MVQGQTQPLKLLMANMFSGGTPNTQIKAYWDGTIPWVSPKDFGDFEIINSTDRVTEAAIQESSSKIAPKNSVLLVVRSGVLIHTLPIGVAGRDLAINQDVKAIICRPTILPQYLAAYFRVFQDRLLPVITKFGATVQSINTAELRNLEIPVPSLTIQKQIVGIYVDALAQMEKNRKDASQMLAGIDAYLLSELDITLPVMPENTIANRTFIAQRQELAGSRFDPHFNKIESISLKEKLEEQGSITLRKIAYKITKGETPLWRGDNYQKDGIAFIRAQNVSPGGLVGELLRIEPSVDLRMKRSQLFGGEILYTMAGTIGVACIYPHLLGRANINQAIAKIVLNSTDQTLKNYLIEILNSSICRLQAERALTVSAQPNINFEQIKSLLIPMPSDEAALARIVSRCAEIRLCASRFLEEAKAELHDAKRRIESILLGEAA